MHVAAVPGEELRLRDDTVAVTVHLEEDGLHLETVEADAAAIAEGAHLLGVHPLGLLTLDGTELGEQLRLVRHGTP